MNLVCGSKSLVAQTKMIQGRVTDSQLNPIEQAIVSIKKIGKSSLLVFTYSDQNGQFILALNDPTPDSLILEVRHTSYQTKGISINKSITEYDFMLEYASTMLEEINIGKPMVYKQNNTLVYDVNAFRTDQDRAIADVLQRLPGIELIDGEIRYQGKAIQKFMINHLDLMRGQYGIIHQNLPAGVVTEVQIIENHQPIRILDSVVHSDRASLNLVVKKLSTTGTMKVGGGANRDRPLWDINLTPIFLARKFQILGSFQSNQAGRNPLEELKNHYDTRRIFQVQAGGVQKLDPTFLQLIKTSAPPLPRNTWLDNQSHLASAHFITKLKKETELRGQVTLSQHLDRQNAHVNRNFQSTGLNSQVTEALDNQFLEKAIETSIGIESNQKLFYFTNVLRFRAGESEDTGFSLTEPNKRMDQNLHLQTYTLMNTLNSIVKIRKHFLQISSDLEWKDAPQTLQINPGALQEILHDDQPYDQLVQFFKPNGWKTKNKISITKQFRGFKFDLPVFFDYRNQKLNSYLTLKDPNTAFQLSSDYSNEIQVLTNEVKIGPNLQYDQGAFTFLLDMPISRLSRHVRYTSSPAPSWSEIIFNPSANIIYKIAIHHELAMQSKFHEDFGTQDLIYPGFIVQDFRTIQNAPNAKMFSRQWQVGSNYKFQKTSKKHILMAYTHYDFVLGTQNYMAANKIDSLGQVVTEIRDQAAQNKTHHLIANLSHYLSKIHTGYGFRYSGSTSHVNYMVNELLLRQRSTRQSIEFNTNNQYLKRLSVFYKLRFTHIRTFYDGNQSNDFTIHTWHHSAELQGQIHSSHHLIIKSSSFENTGNTNMQWFLDATYRYRISSLKMDLDLSYINMLNENQYINQRYTDFGLLETRFQMRPRQLMVSLQWQIGK